MSLTALRSAVQYFLATAEGEPWFTIHDDPTWNIKLKYHTLETVVNGVYKKEHYPFKLLVFNTWHHLCLGVNLETGEYTVVQKGNVMKDTVYMWWYFQKT